jgi:Cu2+-exporting ATPase
VIVTEVRPFRVVSAIPGRIRLQISKEFQSRRNLEELGRHASALPGVAEAVVIADASSVVVRYAVTQMALPEMVRRLEGLPLTHSTAMDSDPSSAARNGRAPLKSPPPPVPNTVIPAAANGHTAMPVTPPVAELPAPEPTADRVTPDDRHSIRIKHFFPGRIRLHIPRLRRRPRLVNSFEQIVTQAPGVTRVETTLDSGYVIVHYDTSVHRATGLLHQVRRALGMALLGLAGSPSHSPRTTEISQEIKGKDLTQEEKQGLNPLVFPTVAIAVAAVGATLPLGVTGLALTLASLPTAAGALEGVRNRRFNVAQLDFSALVALGILGQFLTGSIMTWLIGLGELIRMKTMRRSRRAISELMSPAGQTAWVERDGVVLSIPLDRLETDDIVCVYPGDQVPVDGVVTEGKGLLDQKVLTGESLPVAKEIGDPVFALTIVADGQLKIRVEHIGAETRAGRVVEMIESAPLSDTRVSNYAAKVGDRLVPGIFGLAGVVYLLTFDLARTASILILDFVTGIRVSAPTTILSAMTGAAKQGIFIKGGKAMETLAAVDAIVFDKTGTLTHGSPYVTDVQPTDAAFTADDVLRLAASAEANLKHPAAKAIVDAAVTRGLNVVPSENMEYLLGQGVFARVDGYALNVGSKRYMHTLGIDISRVAQLIERKMAAAESLVFCALDGRLIGLICYSDPPRGESEMVIRALRDRGVKRIVMLTGDNLRAAQAVAGRLGITDIIAEAFPEQKADVVSSLRDEGYTVAVIGDGINDSPAFTRANVGISLQHGADVAKETADVILLDGDLRGLPRAIDLSREAIRILTQNVNVIIAPTVIGMAAAAVGMSNPLISTFINNGTTVITGLNALRPMFPKPHRNEPLPALPPAETTALN